MSLLRTAIVRKRVGITLNRLFEQQCSQSMLRFQSTTANGLKSKQSIDKLLDLDIFSKLNDRKELNGLQPYEFALKIRDKLKSYKDISQQQQQLEQEEIEKSIYNSLVENLTKYDYAVSSVCLNTLKPSQVSVESLIEMVKYNPGRRLPTWELFKDYLPNIVQIDDTTTTTTRDELFKVVLQKLVQMDPIEIEEGKNVPDSKDLTRIVFLLLNMNNTTLRSVDLKETLTKIYEYLLETNSSVLLKPFLDKLSQLGNFGSLPIDLHDKYVSTNLQKFSIDLYEFNSNNNKEVKTQVLHDIVDLVNTLENKPIGPFVQEEKPTQEILHESSRLSTLHQFLPVELEISETIDASKIFKNDVYSKLDLANHKDISLIAKIMRNIGSVNNDSYELSQIYSQRNMNEEKIHPIQFEKALAVAIEAYKKDDFSQIQKIIEMLPEKNKDMVLENKICRLLIILYSKFDIEKSLTLFNENIAKYKTQGILKEDEEATVKNGLSLAGHLSESLILAYLSKKDLHFAHVIFEGSVREKIVDGQAAIKEIKKLLSFYGNNSELPEQEFQKAMDSRVVSYLRNI